MKKVLSFVLVLAMILGSVSTVFGASLLSKVTADNTAVPFADAQDFGPATVLRDLGGLKGNENGLVNLTGTLTRAEAATIVVRALGLGDPAPQATKFKDVPKDAWYSGYVAMAVAAGAMKGQSATTFAPEADITLDECVALVAQTLGYDAAHLAGSWPVNYRNVARKLFLDTVNVGTAKATRKDLIQLIYNALDCNQVAWVEDTKGGYVGVKDDTIYGETLFQAITGLVSTGAVYGQTDAVVVTAETPFANDFDASAFYGQSVILLTKKAKNGVQNIGIVKVNTEMLTGKFVAVKGTTDSFIKFVDSKDNTYTFNITTTAVTGETSVANATTLTTKSSIAAIFENGVALDGVFMNGMLNDKKTYEICAKLSTDKTEIVDISSIAYWDVDAVAVVTSTQAGFFANEDILSLNKTGANKFAKEFMTTKAATGNKYEYLANSCVVEGDATSFAEIEEDDVVEIFCGPSTDKVVKLLVTRNKVVGKVTAWTEKDSAFSAAKVAGKQYKKSTGNVTSALDTVRNYTSEYAFYLDSTGSVVAYGLADKTVASSNSEYGFLTYYDTDIQKDRKKVTLAGITVPGEGETEYVVSTVAFTSVPTGKLVKFNLVDGKIEGLDAVDTTFTNEAFKVKDGMIVSKNYEFASNVKIYKYVGTKVSDPNGYKAYDFSEIEGKNFDDSEMYFVTTSAVKPYEIGIIVLSGSGTILGNEAKVTGAAYISADGTEKDADGRTVYRYTFMTVEDGKKEYISATPLPTMTAGALFNFDVLVGEETEIVSGLTVTSTMAALAKANITSAAIENNVLTGTSLLKDPELAVVRVDADYTVWLCDTVAKSTAVFADSSLAEVTDDDLFVNVGDNSILNAYDIDENGRVDLITVYLVK